MNPYISYWVEQKRMDGKWVPARMPFGSPEGSFTSLQLAKAWRDVWREEWEKVLNGLPLPFEIAGLSFVRIVKRELREEVVE